VALVLGDERLDGRDLGDLVPERGRILSAQLGATLPAALGDKALDLVDLLHREQLSLGS
jgi:hypothetical protein